MIDFKEQFRNEATAILNENAELDEGLGSILGSGLKGLGKGALNLGKGIVSMPGKIKKVYDAHQVAKWKEAIRKNTLDTIQLTANQVSTNMKNINALLKDMLSASDLDKAANLLSKIKDEDTKMANTIASCNKIFKNTAAELEKLPKE